MLVNINQYGTLIIQPNSELESFALDAWFRSFKAKDGNCKLQIESLDGVCTSNVYPEIIDNKVEKSPKEIIKNEIPLAANHNDTDVNKDRISKAGNHLIPSDDEVYNYLKETNSMFLPIEIAEHLQIEKGKEVKTHSVYNALQRLKTEGKVEKEKVNDVVFWKVTSKSPKNNDDVLDEKLEDVPKILDTHKPYSEYK